MRRLHLEGMKFGRLTVDRYENGMWVCKCVCGRDASSTTGNLTSGDIKSCGCLRRETAAASGRSKATHGLTGTAEWIVWNRMIQRCHNPANNGYPWYGAIGISVCDQWRGRDGFANFLSDIGNRPTLQHQLGRKGDSGNYEPGNCWWQTPLEQGENRKDQVWLEHGGERLRVKDWARRLGLHRRSLLSRLENGWSVEEALTTPVMSQFRHS